jgi:FKBP-type peptidyl-prolyl cis-trans isomerase
MPCSSLPAYRSARRRGAALALAAAVALTSCASHATPPAVSRPANGPVTFNGVTVVGGTNLKQAPTVTSKSTTSPSTLEYKDLVVGTGQVATQASTVTVQYVGALYSNGKVFDASWTDGGATGFPLDGTIPGFTQGIGGTGSIPAMKIGGRRLMILPGSLGYVNGDSQAGIAPGAPLVFVVDLLEIQ